MIIRFNDTDVYIAECHGGIAYPGKRPGYACVLGVAGNPDDDLGGKRHMYILQETEQWNSQKLLEEAAIMRDKFRFDYYWGQGYHDEANNKFLRDWNRMMKAKTVRELRVYPAYMSDKKDITYHLNVLDTVLEQGKVLLHNTIQSIFRRQVSDMLKSKNTSPVTNVFEYPAVTAMGYTVTMIQRSVRDEVMPYVSPPTDKRSITGY